MMGRDRETASPEEGSAEGLEVGKLVPGTQFQLL